LDIAASVTRDSGEVTSVRSNIKNSIQEIFGANSPEFTEHQYLDIWAGGMYMGMSPGAIIQGTERGRTKIIGILKGLIGRLQEKREELAGGATPAPSTYFDRLNLHPRIRDVARDLFMDGHPWDAVFAASKALVNFVKERSGRHDLDGAALMRTVFSRNNPILA